MHAARLLHGLPTLWKDIHVLLPAPCALMVDNLLMDITDAAAQASYNRLVAHDCLERHSLRCCTDRLPVDHLLHLRRGRADVRRVCPVCALEAPAVHPQCRAWGPLKRSGSADV